MTTAATSPLPALGGAVADDDDDRQVAQVGIRRVDIPAAEHEAFAEIVARRLHRQRALVHWWVVCAAHVAEHAIAADNPSIVDPTVVPPRRSLPTVHGDVKMSRIRWQQDEDEYRRCLHAVTAVGSSLTVVIRANIATYNRLDGDLFAFPLRLM